MVIAAKLKSTPSPSFVVSGKFERTFQFESRILVISATAKITLPLATIEFLSFALKPSSLGVAVTAITIPSLASISLPTRLVLESVVILVSASSASSTRLKSFGFSRGLAISFQQSS